MHPNMDDTLDEIFVFDADIGSTIIQLRGCSMLLVCSSFRWCQVVSYCRNGSDYLLIAVCVGFLFSLVCCCCYLISPYTFVLLTVELVGCCASHSRGLEEFCIFCFSCLQCFCFRLVICVELMFCSRRLLMFFCFKVSLPCQLASAVLL